MDGQRRLPSSLQLWSWMERNANDLTELKSSKSLFLYFCWLVLIVLSLLCRFMYCTLVLTTHLE